MSNKYTREDALSLLRVKSRQLTEQGIFRYPKRSDFSDDEVSAIKAFLGPWPRALEKAGLKPVDENRAEEKLQKRIASKRKKTQYKIEKKDQPKIRSDF